MRMEFLYGDVFGCGLDRKKQQNRRIDKNISVCIQIAYADLTENKLLEICTSFDKRNEIRTSYTQHDHIPDNRIISAKV